LYDYKAALAIAHLHRAGAIGSEYEAVVVREADGLLALGIEDLCGIRNKRLELIGIANADPPIGLFQLAEELGLATSIVGVEELLVAAIVEGVVHSDDELLQEVKEGVLTAALDAADDECNAW
jgi:hypothetical protein